MKRIEKMETVFFSLGTVCSVIIFDREKQNVLSKIKQKVFELNNKLNAFDPQSEISAINMKAGVDYVNVSNETYRMVEQSIIYSKSTDGFFDITTKPLSDMWKKAIRSHSIPLYDDIMSAKKLVNYNDILLNNGAIMLRKEKQMIDLGAIAKGRIADIIKHILNENEVKDAIVNLGGTVFVKGEKRNVGIQNPSKPYGNEFARFQAKDCFIITSGLYEQGINIGGITYHHIINPKTGYPSESELSGITLIGANGEWLDVMSTYIMMLPLSKAVGFIKESEVEAVMVCKNGSIYFSDTLRKRISIERSELV